MALRLAEAFGGTAEIWYRLQRAYDLAQAQKPEIEITQGLRGVAMGALLGDGKFSDPNQQKDGSSLFHVGSRISSLPAMR